MILTKKKMYPKTDMLNISNIKKGGFHMKKNRKIFRIQSKKRSDYIRRWTDACLILKNACFLLQEKRCACQPMSLIWKTY